MRLPNVMSSLASADLLCSYDAPRKYLKYAWTAGPVAAVSLLFLFKF